MIGIPLAFATPLVLSALVLLPAIWWLLRLTPPKPRLQAFPPVRLLLEIAKKEETPSKSPWWLTALRLFLAALVIFALAGPILRPVAEEAPGSGPLLVLLDNSWSSARRWDATVETAKRVIGLADRSGRSISLIATAEGTGQPMDPADAGQALKRLEALGPRPYPADRAGLIPALGTVTDGAHFGGVVWLSDGLGGADADAITKFLADKVKAPVLVYDDAGINPLGLKPPTATADALSVPLVRRDKGTQLAGTVRALDLKARVVGEVNFDFARDATTTNAAFTLPAELRNEIVRLEISGNSTAGAVQLMDDRFRRRKIGLITGANADTAQPLLSPLYYIERAVQPYADVRRPSDINPATAVPELIDYGVSVIAMADIGTMPKEVSAQVAKWVNDGGTLVRFAGPHLAAQTDDTLVPVRLRLGDRVLGGSLSWETPQPLASFSPSGPFAGMAVPGDVTVSRQVLAEPDGGLPQRTWAALADGTPLVTAAQTGKGWIVLFHVTADTSWSNLPLSGAFVEMLRRIAAFSTAAKGSKADTGSSVALLPPYRVLDGYGRFAAPGSRAQAIRADAPDTAATAERPPGLYGAEDGFRAVNLLDANSVLLPFSQGALSSVTLRPYPTEEPQDLSPYLLALALAVLLLDAVAVLWLAGMLRIRRTATAGLLVAMAIGALALAGHPASAAGTADGVAQVNKTHLAYVLTGNPTVDSTSRSGLSGLSRVMSDRTAFEPAEPIGVDASKDELAFFPLLYWPIDASAPAPSPATMARVDAYMKQGGTVLFDTRDQLDRATDVNSFSGSPAADRLRQMLSTLDVPPLEPVPPDHVLTKTFYLLSNFPGRYTGGALWVEASAPAAGPDRPVRAGDGVSSIMITENDFASAWATDARGSFLFPTVPADATQREMAFRAGINILMYTLTGNYKADQVHIPALLERLGQ